MSTRPDLALCPVSAKSCTHHAHCARAQLPPNPTRKVWFTLNRRGDECQYFAPVEAYQNLTPAGSDAAQVERPLVEAGGVQFDEAARSARAVGQQPTATATNATLSPASSYFSGTGNAGVGVVEVEPCASAGGVPSAPPVCPTLSEYEREQLAAARVIFPNTPPTSPHRANDCRDSRETLAGLTQ